MSEIKALDKLREYVDKQREEYNNHNVSFVWQLDTIADEIEAEWQDSYDAMCLEIERDYMKLPVDADGVPIHVGDICTKLGERFEVRQLRTDGDAWWTIDRFGESYMANFCHHAKQHTLEDVLEEYADEYYRLVRDGLGSIAKLKMQKAADEIRELLGE